MKKILTMLASLAIVGSSTLTVMACNKRKPNEIWVQTNTIWLPSYQKAAKKVNKSFKDRGLDWQIKLKEIDIFQEKEIIGTRGIRDKSVSDIFTVPIGDYVLYLNKNNLYDMTDLIKTKLVNDKDGQERYGIKPVNNKSGLDGLDMKDSKDELAWKSAIAPNQSGKAMLGFVPMAIENQLWIFDENRIGIKKEVKDNKKYTYLVGDEIKDVQNLDKWNGEAPEKAKNQPKASIENIIKINLSKKNNEKISDADNKRKIDTTKGAPFIFLDAAGSFIGGMLLNSILVNNLDKIKNLKADFASDGLVWIKKGVTNPKTKNKNDYDSIFENEEFSEELKLVGNTITDYVKSLGGHIEVLYSGNPGQVGQILANARRDGVTAMTLAGSYEVSGKLKELQDGHKVYAAKQKAEGKTVKEPKYGFASIGDVTFGGGKYKITGFAGGFGWGIKSTIDKRIAEQKDEKGKVVANGIKLSKAEAAMEFIKEISSEEYATDLAYGDGKISPFKKVGDHLVKELKEAKNINPKHVDGPKVGKDKTESELKEEKEIRNILGNAYESILESYQGNGKDGQIASRSNNELFGIYWDTFSEAFGATLNTEINVKKEDFATVLKRLYKDKKTKYVFG
ncbi:lipoprotein [Mycoplasma capricolum]|uniref:lipoprotein n=1 Tax=Mycoplasma capricolum TaxID=2095 RepID=UPI0022F39A05|nr:lipoprotein [Mycoplasma capricolum]WBX35859.1 lipoprotein [Mycoplasma capricolum subsp. capricolum]